MSICLSNYTKENVIGKEMNIPAYMCKDVCEKKRDCRSFFNTEYTLMNEPSETYSECIFLNVNDEQVNIYKMTQDDLRNGIKCQGPDYPEECESSDYSCVYHFYSMFK